MTCANQVLAGSQLSSPKEKALGFQGRNEVDWRQLNRSSHTTKEDRQYLPPLSLQKPRAQKKD